MPDTQNSNSREPYLGAVVWYVDAAMGDVYPAIITRLLPNRRVLLTLFQPNTAPFPHPGVVEHCPKPSEGATPLQKGTWIWPNEEFF